MRCFLAIELPEPVREALACLCARLRRSDARVSWPRPGNLHLTLRFLGEIDAACSDAIQALLRTELSSHPAMRLHVNGTGAFPNLRRPSVVWAGVSGSDAELVTIQAACEAAAQSVGLKPEPKVFRPHITLGRIREPARLGSLIAALEREKDFDGGEFLAAGVTLFSSILTPQGAVYEPVAAFPLVNSGNR